LTIKDNHEYHEVKQKNHETTGLPKVIVLSGPTASGKTALSLRLAKALGGEIVSADSMQVYRGMDIGTAKPTPEEKGDVPHYLIDIRELSEQFNVVDFYYEALDAIRSIHARGKVPIVVGGTGFYIHSLIYGPPQGPPASKSLRKLLEEEIEKFGPEFFYEKLKTLDPEYAAKITKGDKQKLIRAFEIMAQTQQPVSAFSQTTEWPREFNFRCWFIHWPKEVLYKRIEERCDEMMKGGLIEEVGGLIEKGLERNLSASQAIGYRQCLDYLKDRDKPRFIALFKQASRRYAKRQFTWFRKEPLFRWLDLNACELEQVVELIIRDYELCL